MPYPPTLDEIVRFFEPMAEGERRENLIAMADTARLFAPAAGETFDFEDVRHDAECTDFVGIHVRMAADGALRFAASLGPKTQTLTRAMAAILCRALAGLRAAEVAAVTPDFAPRIIGSALMRRRSQTVYYMLRRMQEAAGKTEVRASLKNAVPDDSERG